MGDPQAGAIVWLPRKSHRRKYTNEWTLGKNLSILKITKMQILE